MQKIKVLAQFYDPLLLFSGHRVFCSPPLNDDKKIPSFHLPTVVERLPGAQHGYQECR